MSNDQLGRVALLWRGDRDGRDTAAPNDRLRPVFAALSALGIAPVPVVYCDAVAEEVRAELRDVDGVLVWVDPIGGGEDRARLDALLREVSSEGVWVSAHPETIQKMGTKEVLFRTRRLSWGTDTRLYATFSEFQAQFPARLATGPPRVLKQNRGNGGLGVWKVEPVTGPASGHAWSPGQAPMVRVQHAKPRDAVTEDVPLAVFMDRCEEYFSGSGCLIDQAFAVRLPEGMIRAYLVGDRVVGFARQQP
ncbi:MAG: Cj0069 family protein, partial [Acidimicrobiia bacterium]